MNHSGYLWRNMFWSGSRDKETSQEAIAIVQTRDDDGLE